VKYLTPYRLAAYLLTFFCVGHTVGGMLVQKSLGPAADAVFGAMKTVVFDFEGARCSYYGFWFGFGLMVSVFLLLSAIVAWQLDKTDASSWRITAPIAWALFVAHLANAVICWAYFFTGAGILSTLAALLLGLGALRGGRLG
jgi:hypothetical protein